MPEASAGGTVRAEAEPTWPGMLHHLVSGNALSAAQTAWAMDRIMLGEATPVQVAGFLVALRAKGENVDELSGLAAAMLEHAVRIDVPGPSVDVVGTGGDRAHTVNISTMAALVVAGAGPQVVKHGNRAASSACGSADVLEELGVRLDLTPEAVARVAGEAGITFCFAQVFHPSFRHAAVARARARRAHGVQLPRAADQPGPTGCRRGGRGGPPDGAAGRRGAGLAGHQCPGVPR